MTSFSRSMRYKGKVEEDSYFARLDKDRVAALREQEARAGDAGQPAADAVKHKSGDGNPPAGPSAGRQKDC